VTGLAPIEALAIAGVVVVAAYTVFGLTGFGSSITGLPFLAQVYPVRVVVPTMLVFDLCASLLLATRQRSNVERGELVSLLPFVVIGMLVGGTLLSQAPERWLMLGLGAFVLLFASGQLRTAEARSAVSTRWAGPAGVAGGALSALYGTGGPLYTLYLARRIAEPMRLRATLAVLIFASALMRLVVFTGSGLLLQPAVGQLALALLPCAALGYLIGTRLHGRVGVAAARRAVWAVIVLGGLGMLVRGALAP
jgi:uncharacterized membrane protein YfcA